MKELLNNYITTGNKKEEEANNNPYDDEQASAANFSLFGNNELPSFIRYGQDST